jgi:hypothetical protein
MYARHYINIYEFVGNFVLNYLSRRLNIPQFVETSLAQLFCLITKLGWFDSVEFRNAVNDVSALSQVGYDLRLAIWPSH